MLRKLMLSLAGLGVACASGSSGGAVVERSRTAAGFDREFMDVSVELASHGSEIGASADRAFKAALQVIEAVDIPLERSTPAQRTAVFLLEGARLRIDGRNGADYLDCGQGPAGPRVSSYRLSMRVAIQVEAVGADRARLHTVVRATARDPGTASAEVPCTSTGRLETLVATRVAERLAQ